MAAPQGYEIIEDGVFDADFFEIIRERDDDQPATLCSDDPITDMFGDLGFNVEEKAMHSDDPIIDLLGDLDFNVEGEMSSGDFFEDYLFAASPTYTHTYLARKAHRLELLLRLLQDAACCTSQDDVDMLVAEFHFEEQCAKLGPAALEAIEAFERGDFIEGDIGKYEAEFPGAVPTRTTTTTTSTVIADSKAKDVKAQAATTPTPAAKSKGKVKQARVAKGKKQDKCIENAAAGGA